MTNKTALAGLAIAAAASAAHGSPNGGADDATLAATASEPAVTIPVLQDGDRIFWKNNLRFASGDGQTTYRIGGRIQYDGSWIGADDAIDASTIDDDADGGTTPEVARFATDDTWSFRRARLHMSGTLYGFIGFKVAYDFAGTDAADFKDVYMTFDNFLVGQLKVGQYKEPFGLDQLASSNNITFMERASLDVLTPARSVGFELSDWYEDSAVGWQVGIFGSDADGSSGDANVEADGYAGTARVSWAPTYDQDNDSVIHVGLAYSTRSTGNLDLLGATEISGLDITGTTLGASDGSDLLGFEAAAVFGPLSLQAEHISATNDLVGGGDADASGFYVQGSFALTGEARTYSKGVFKGISPNSPWGGFGGDGTGAWEVAFRYSTFDVDNVSETTGLTAGVNWYLNKNARIMANYTLQGFEDEAALGATPLLDEDAEALQVRFQLTF